MKRRNQTHDMVTLALCASLAMVLAYLESLLPPIFNAVPGIKMGLPNLVIVFVLYRFGTGRAAIVSLVRLVAVAQLFGTPVTFAYSLAGAMLSLLLMAILKKTDLLSPVGVSVAGAVAHNLGQILMAMYLLGTAELGYYMVVLAVTGTISGIFIGLGGGLLIKRFSGKV